MSTVTCCVTHPVIPQLFPDYACDHCAALIDPASLPQCSTCERCADCCACYACDHCAASIDPASLPQCSTCDACDTCCDCHVCERCDVRVASDDDTFCSVCDCCERCCERRGECWTCEGCDSRLSSDSYTCGECNQCENCCDCSHCGGCGDTYRNGRGNFCSGCDRCGDCCDCSEGDNSSVLTDGRLTFHTASKLQHKHNTSTRHISLELEVSEDDGSGEDYVTPAAQRWNDPIVEDGSLPSSGYEINTNPSSGDVFLSHLEDITEGLRSAGAKVDSSCGMHCHIATPDYSYFDLFKLCHLYASIEDGLFSIVSRGRRGGTYSQSCGERYTFTHYATFKADLTRALYGSQALEVKTSRWDKKLSPETTFHRGKHRLANKAERYNSARYMALNLHSFFYRGTIEFRHHQGTTRYTRATNWGMICAAIVDAASRLTIAQIDALPCDPFQRLLAILPTDALRDHARTRRSELA